MKISYNAIMTAAQVLQLDANMTRHDERREMLQQVATALLALANGAGDITMDQCTMYEPRRSRRGTL